MSVIGFGALCSGFTLGADAAVSLALEGSTSFGGTALTTLGASAEAGTFDAATQYGDSGKFSDIDWKEAGVSAAIGAGFALGTAAAGIGGRYASAYLEGADNGAGRAYRATQEIVTSVTNAVKGTFSTIAERVSDSVSNRLTQLTECMPNPKKIWSGATVDPGIPTLGDDQPGFLTRLWQRGKVSEETRLSGRLFVPRDTWNRIVKARMKEATIDRILYNAPFKVFTKTISRGRDQT